MNNSTANENQQSKREPTSFRYRPFVIALFAVILFSIASKVKADDVVDVADPAATQHGPVETEVVTSPQSHHAINAIAPVSNAQEAGQGHAVTSAAIVQYNGTIHSVPRAAVYKHPIGQSAFTESEHQRLASIHNRKGRPMYVELHAALANFDADADPDGWRVQLVLRDTDDRPVVMRAQAKFELTPRIPVADYHGFADASHSSVSWSQEVKFGDDGVARFKLPLQQRLRPMFGWSTTVYPQSGVSSPTAGRRPGHAYRGSLGRSSIARRTGNTFASDLRDSLTRPHLGELRVRVSVPTEGVFAAATPVQVRPPVLVDTQWPYR